MHYDRRTLTPGVATSTALCDACLAAGHAAASVLVLDYVDLEQQIARAGGGGEMITGTREQPIPLALHIEALQRQIWFLATTSAAILRELDHLAPAPANVRDGWAVQRALEIVRPRIPRLADADPVERTGAQAVIALVALHGRVRVTLGLTHLVHELPGECTRCTLPTLRRDNGSDEIWCAACEAWWGTADDYATYTELVVREAKAKRRHPKRR